MVEPGQDAQALRPVDVRALQRGVARLQSAPQAPWLHGEVARRMAERLAILRHEPEVVIDWWSHLGAGAELLRQAYPKARSLVVEPMAAAGAALRRDESAAWWSPRRWRGRAAPPCGEDEVPVATAQLLWANMSLHGRANPQRVMRAWQRALAVDGFLMFSTLGPGSLQGLRELYRDKAWPAPAAAFVDMHDLGDMLVEAGFADPVMDQEMVTLTWSSPAALLSELRGLGGNCDPDRFAGLRTPRWRAELQAALGVQADPSGRVSLAFEIVYGHAVRVAPRPAVAPVTAVALDDMRMMVRSRPRS